MNVKRHFIREEDGTPPPPPRFLPDWLTNTFLLVTVSMVPLLIDKRFPLPEKLWSEKLWLIMPVCYIGGGLILALVRRTLYPQVIKDWEKRQTLLANKKQNRRPVF